MRNSIRPKIKLVLVFCVVLVVIIEIIKGSVRLTNSKKSPPIVKNGVIDLQNWDFKRDGMIKLNGDWEYYDMQLLSPEDFSQKLIVDKKYVVLPGSYNRFGYGTYRLKVLLNKNDDIYGLKIDFIQSAYKIWVNNKQIAYMGRVGKDKNTMNPQLLPQNVSFHVQDGEVYLTLQVSNFYAKQGFIDSIIVGNLEQVESYQDKKLAFDLFLFGCTLMAAVYNLGLFLKRKKDKSLLYFAMVCILIAIRTLFLGERFFISLFPQFNYIISGKIMHWTFYLYIPFIGLFINSFHDGILPKDLIQILKASIFVYGVLVLISPWKYYQDIIIPFEIISIFLLVYMIYKVSKVYLRNNSNEIITAAVLFSLLLTRCNDILYEYSIIITGSFAPFGTLIFILGSSYILAGRQSAAFSEVENMSEKLKSLNGLKDNFLAITSHELKTPLNGIIGLSEELISGGSRFSKEEMYNLNLINSSAKRLSNLVNDITVTSRLKNGEIDLDKKPVNINKIAEMVIKTLQPSLNNKDVSIRNLINCDAPLIYGDEDRIQQILYNILGNSVKFTSIGYITLSYSIKGKLMELYIEDTGIGIRSDKLDKIFLQYEQVEGISERFGGTGLGLYITHKLVELHGGSIKAESSINKGSRFTFTLPLCDDNKLKRYTNLPRIEEKKEHESEIYAQTFADKIVKSDITNRYKILVVDDDFINQKVLENYLSKSNIEIIKASSGNEALRLIREIKDLDLVILDMMMPDLMGYEVCTIIRERYSLFELPVLIMTVDNRVENLIVSFECGANDYLIKPLNKHSLSSRVNTLLILKQSVQEALALSQQVAVTAQQVVHLSQQNEASSKKVEELKEFDKLKTEFFTNMSHELRTPLNVLSSTIQLLKSLDHDRILGDEKIRYYFNIMNQNSSRLLRLINNLIDTTRLDGGYLALNLQNGNIVESVEDIVQSVAEYIKSKGINIIFDTEIEEKFMAFDVEKLERIILNILSNAVKFTNKKGSIFVNICDRNEFIEISVKDTGIGIPSDKIELIFERFMQVDRSTTRSAEGSGIGLSLVKSLVEMHGGNIRVESEVGIGSEFIITLPVKVIDTTVEANSIIYREVQKSRYEKNSVIEFSDIY